MKPIFSLTLILALTFDLTALPAHAYLDPGAGSQFLQMSLAGLFGLLFALKTMITKFLQRVRDRRSK